MQKMNISIAIGRLKRSFLETFQHLPKIFNFYLFPTNYFCLTSLLTTIFISQTETPSDYFQIFYLLFLSYYYDYGFNHVYVVRFNWGPNSTLQFLSSPIGLFSNPLRAYIFLCSKLASGWNSRILLLDYSSRSPMKIVSIIPLGAQFRGGEFISLIS